MKEFQPYRPDNWVIVEIANDDGIFYKVLAGWSGGYLDGDSWRMNSGITEVEEKEDYYLFYGQSGSVYKCWKEAEKTRINMGEPLAIIEANDMAKVVEYKDIKNELKQK
jgi:hypothetical protein|tara:strand:+ start:540 stop:866 length:327 start_codon:yes stop_codon:yes gene_type:complete